MVSINLSVFFHDISAYLAGPTASTQRSCTLQLVCSRFSMGWRYEAQRVIGAVSPPCSLGRGAEVEVDVDGDSA